MQQSAKDSKSYLSFETPVEPFEVEIAVLNLILDGHRFRIDGFLPVMLSSPARMPR
jgi:hypothetical protein